MRCSSAYQWGDCLWIANSELLCEAFLHAFTGQPLPTDDDLNRNTPEDIPLLAKHKNEK